jgi:hypothetical protein
MNFFKRLNILCYIYIYHNQVLWQANRFKNVQNSQKSCWIMVKNVIFSTYVSILTFKHYVNHSKLCQMTIMSVEKLK